MNNTRPKPSLNDPKDYPKAGDIVLPIPDSIKREAEERAKNYMALKTPPGEKKATWDLKPNHGSEAIVNQSIEKIDNLAFADESDVFGEPTKENKQWVLTAMGFVSRGPGRWFHPVLGEDFDYNWLWFDLETDDLKSLTPKLYRTGWVYGQRELRWKFKQLLDIKL